MAILTTPSPSPSWSFFREWKKTPRQPYIVAAVALKEAGYDVLVLGPTDSEDMAKHLGIWFFYTLVFLEGRACRALKSHNSQIWPMQNAGFSYLVDFLDCSYHVFSIVLRRRGTVRSIFSSEKQIEIVWRKLCSFLLFTYEDQFQYVKVYSFSQVQVILALNL